LVNEGEPLLVIVTHFKSKRGGAAETDEIRRSQASHLAEYVAGAVSESSMPAIILGDFNDYESSTSMEVLANEGNMTNSLEMIERSNRYTFIFDGERQLIDWIMVSASLREKVVEARIAHLNSDFSYKLDQNVSPEFLALRSSDHDIPLIIVEWGEVSPEPIVVATDERSTTSKPTSTTIPVQEDGSIPGLTSSAEDRSLIIGGALALGIAVLSLLLVLKRRSQRF
jgi:predicted extracellular nuclease